MAVIATIPAVYNSNRLRPIPMTATVFKIPCPMIETGPVVSTSLAMSAPSNPPASFLLDSDCVVLLFKYFIQFTPQRCKRERLLHEILRARIENFLGRSIHGISTANDNFKVRTSFHEERI